MVDENVYDWAVQDMTSVQPQPLVIEIYLDVAELGRNQTLVISDDRGTKWDVCKALGTSRSSTSSKTKAKSTQIVLERWKLQLKQHGIAGEPELLASTVYKHSLVMFRALYTHLRSLPAWRLGRRIAKEPASLVSLKPAYRIVPDSVRHESKDLLTTHLYPSSELTTTKHIFPATKTPIGPFCAEVTYRTKCDFHVVDTDSLLSSQFRVMDGQHFKPSLDNVRKGDYFDQKDVSSLPSHWRSDAVKQPHVHAYGSLATYHEAGVDTSPLTALRTLAEPTSIASPPANAQPNRAPPDHRAIHSSKSSLKAISEVPQSLKDPRRTSVSFAGKSPFKAGSLASSPLFQAKSSRKTTEKIDAVQDTRKRNSLTTTLPQAALRIPAGAITDIGVESSSPSSSKPPIVRYSSSFGNRRANRLSSGGGSRGSGEDPMVSSSLRGSQSSSNPPSSGALPSSPIPGSLQNDDDQLADFIKLLDQKKELRSLNRTDAASKDASTRKTAAALNKYKSLRESQMALADSLSSSTMIHRSSTSSSRVPALVAGSSLSSVSPGGPKSPHTPHTPAIPSRLSSAAIAEDFEDGPDSPAHSDHSDRGRTDSSDLPESSTIQQVPGSRPIDVPMSPQHRLRSRRSSSVKLRRLVNADSVDEYSSRRTASVPVRERGETKRTPLIEATIPEGQSDGPADTAIPKSLLAAELAQARAPRNAKSPEPLVPRTIVDRSSLAPSTLRGGRGSTHSLGRSSSAGSGSGRPERYSFGMSRHGSGSGGAGSLDEEDPEEPLLFTMSELEAQQAKGV